MAAATAAGVAGMAKAPIRKKQMHVSQTPDKAKAGHESGGEARWFSLVLFGGASCLLSLVSGDSWCCGEVHMAMLALPSSPTSFRIAITPCVESSSRQVSNRD
jgi:hypothetical protein